MQWADEHRIGVAKDVDPEVFSENFSRGAPHWGHFSGAASPS
jgi:hypothetical protein